MAASVYTRYLTIDPTREGDLRSHAQSDITIRKLKQDNMFRIEGERTSRRYIDGLVQLFALGC